MVLNVGRGMPRPYLVIAEVDLDFVDAFEDLFGVGFDIGADKEKVFSVVGFVEKKILLHVG